MTTPIYLRDVARALEAHLNSAEGTAVHWIAVEGESSLDKAPTQSKPTTYFEEVEIVAVLSNGHSEGSLITIAGRRDRYQRGQIEPLLLIKTDGVIRAGTQAALAVRWFEEGMPGLAEEQAARAAREAARGEAPTHA